MLAGSAIIMMATLVVAILQVKNSRAEMREEKINKDLLEKAIQEMAKEQAIQNADPKLDHLCTCCGKVVTITDVLCNNKFNSSVWSSTGWYRPIHLDCDKAELNQ